MPASARALSQALALAFFPLLLFPQAAPQDTKESLRTYFVVEGQTLKGIERVGGCVVTGSENFLKRQIPGLTPDDVCNDVKLRLRMAGIRVSDDPEPLYTRGRTWGRYQPVGPYLQARVLVLQYKSGAFAAFVQLECIQPVILLRDSALGTSAPTWSSSNFLVRGTEDSESDFVKATREQLKELADKFANAYLSVNPR